ncbi:MAG: radical SAM protein [Lachnospiraceae bacterium]|nr:radical SAM protein [Lachnospiraceae bacterium]MDY5742653.1 radical SAM protein [Lachnospiraceae bacterium]
MNDFFVLEKNDDYFMIYKPYGTIKKLSKDDYVKFLSATQNESDQIALEGFCKTVFAKKTKLSYEEGLCDKKKLSKLELVLTNKCNLDCKYCYAEGGSYSMEEKSVTSRDLERYLTKLIPSYYNEIGVVMFFGGEPLINFQAIKTAVGFFENLYMQNLLQKLPHYTMVTNGTLINEEVAKFIAEHQIQVTVSIDGNKTIHDMLRPYKNGKGSYEKVVEGIRLLQIHGAQLALLEATYTKKHIENGISRNQVIEFLKGKFNSTEIYLVDCQGDSRYAIDSHQNTVKKVVDKSAKLAVLRGVKRIGSNDYYCDAGLQSFAIDPNGLMVPCHFFIGKQEYCIGNLKEKKLFSTEYENIKNRLQSIRRRKNQHCKDCWSKEMCSACPAIFLLELEKAYQNCANRRERNELVLQSLLDGKELR